MVEQTASTRSRVLSDFWNELVQPSGQPSAGAPLDPVEADTVRRLHALGANPPPASSLARVRRALEMDARSQAALGNGSRASLMTRTVATHGRRAASSTTATPRQERSGGRTWRLPIHPRWAVAQLSLALLLAFMLGGLWLMFGQEGSRLAGPAQSVSVQMAGPVPGMSDGAFVVLRRITLDPGASYADIRHGPTMVLVETGTFSFKSLLDRDERTLHPGETGTAASYSTVIVRNESTSPGSFLIAGVFPRDTGLWVPYLNPGMSLAEIMALPLFRDLPNGATLKLQQTTIARGERAAPWRTAGPAWIVVEDGDLGLTLTGSNLPYQFQSGVERSRASGTRVQLNEHVTVDMRNDGSTPLSLLILTITPT